MAGPGRSRIASRDRDNRRHRPPDTLSVHHVVVIGILPLPDANGETCGDTVLSTPNPRPAPLNELCT